MKRNLLFQKKNLFFNPLKSKRISSRLTRKFWFFTKYFYYGPHIRNMFVKTKKHFFFVYNLLRFFFTVNWTKFFSNKYYAIYLENVNAFFLKFRPSLVKFTEHLGELQKPFFIDKKILYHLPHYYWSGFLRLKVDQFFLSTRYFNFLCNYYKLIVTLILLRLLRHKSFY